jgi:hypothetical protein
VPDPDPIEFNARLEVSENHLRGELCLPDGRRMAFDGWLGLISAIEAASSASVTAGGDAEPEG